MDYFNNDVTSGTEEAFKTIAGEVGQWWLGWSGSCYLEHSAERKCHRCLSIR